MNDQAMTQLSNSDRVGVVVARFEPEIADRLVASVRTVVKESGGNEQHIDWVNVPGALEVPYALKLLINRGGYRCYVVLGCVIRGETTHYDVVVNECVRGCFDLVREFTVPFGFGIITANTYEQAIARSGTNRCVGQLAMRAAMQMASLSDQVKRI